MWDLVGAKGLYRVAKLLKLKVLLLSCNDVAPGPGRVSRSKYVEGQEKIVLEPNQGRN